MVRANRRESMDGPFFRGSSTTSSSPAAPTRRSTRSGPQPPLHNPQDVGIGDGNDQPEVHALGGIVPLDPPAVSGVGGSALDADRTRTVRPVRQPDDDQPARLR